MKDFREEELDFISNDSEDDFEFQTEEDAVASVSFFNANVNTLLNEKGVK